MKNGNYEYNDLPNSYQNQTSCGICEHLKLTNKRTDYNGKVKYYCDKCHAYYKQDNKICGSVLISPSNYKRLGSYQPSGCYITTIVCDVLGYDDNCEVLTTLRNFRDNYLKKHSEYLTILFQYDILGPIISEYIRKEKNNQLLCNGLYKYFLIPCVDAIKCENIEEAIQIYENMVMQLHDDFDLGFIKIPDNMEYDIETLGKGRLRKLKTSDIY